MREVRQNVDMERMIYVLWGFLDLMSVLIKKDVGSCKNIMPVMNYLLFNVEQNPLF